MPKHVYDDFEEPTRVPETGNPLMKHFRMPGPHVKLPSQGRFMPPGSVELTASGEVAVWPMTAYDEVMLKSPDALLSGYAIEKLIESCVPAIKNVKALSAPDLDVLLLAIRAATYGSKMPVEASCPECGYANEFDDLDISGLLDNVQELDAENIVELSPELAVSLRPYTVANATHASLSAYQEAKKMKGLEGASDDERQTAINEGIGRLNRMNLMLTADCIIRVITKANGMPENEVVNRQHIAEFVQQIPANWFNMIEAKLKAINKHGLDKKQGVKCIKCGHEWVTDIEFDPSSFFVLGS